MSEKKLIPTNVFAEMTPNPATMKFAADRMLIEDGGQVEYRSIEEAMSSSPLAIALFNFPFVSSIFISGNYVTITKTESIDWDLILMQLRDFIREWLMNNELAVTSIPEEMEYKGNDYGVTHKAGAIDYSKFEATEHDEQIMAMLEEMVRPAVERDGGAIDFKAFNDGKVYVQLKGACSGCPSAAQTLKGGIETLLKSNFEFVEEVVAEEV